MKNIYLYIIILSVSITQEIFTDYLIIENDTIDVFSYQIPENYNPNNQHPLLVAFHQWGGNENSNYYTQFDEEANDRGWIMLSPYGGAPNNYNHQGAQAMVEGEILWMMNQFNINKNKIYMVGGSMGGASGAIYANNHLNPNFPMVAATASASGILDCERRAIEMDGNNSMIEWFGGNWDEVPFEYHRNSAIYFADSTQSMHYNLKYTPLYLDFGTTEPHRTHAEELYEILLNYNESMWIDNNPTGSHGYSVFDENHVCNWLEQFSLDYLDQPYTPNHINVNLDEPSRAYWIEAYNQYFENDFIRINAEWYDSDGGNNEFISINQFNNSDSLVLHILDEQIENFSLQLNDFYNIATIGFAGPIIEQISEYNTSISGPGSPGCGYAIDFNNNIFWLTTYTNCTIDLGIYNLQFEFILNQNIYDDINQDGTWDVLDIILTVNHIMENSSLSQNEQELADLNNDGIINILDIIEIVNIIIN
tara:strand:+ start:722 stop:2155 length:1434 start_codon:yes stop_codon:yes gene_type:complete